jgi:hypothetical protein
MVDIGFRKYFLQSGTGFSIGYRCSVFRARPAIGSERILEYWQVTWDIGKKKVD